MTDAHGASPSRRGRPPGHHLDDIVDATVAVMDANGLSAVSMHAVAGKVGMSRMGLYRYVSSKEELLALLPEHLLKPTAATVLGESTSMAALRAVADGITHVLVTHPHATPLLTNPRLGPAMLAAAHHCVALLEADGAPPTDGFEMVRSVVALTIGQHATSHGTTSTLGIDLLLGGIAQHLRTMPLMSPDLAAADSATPASKETL
jgi:AcrR family transcriptional regulator